MGNTESVKSKEQTKAVHRRSGEPSEGKLLIKTKNILLLHKSDAAQLNVVYNFRDALSAKTNGSVHVTDLVNIMDGKEMPHTLEWLDERNNVVLICLTPESTDNFWSIILDKGFADQNGRLHPKVFSVTFGESLASKWPPKGLKKGSTDLRDFYFEFADVDNIRQKDFQTSLRLNSLIAAIKLTN